MTNTASTEPSSLQPRLRAHVWEAILPEAVLRMPAELEAVGRLLDDPAFFKPYRAHFAPEHGRPSIPIETYLPKMFLRFGYRLDYETLCPEVGRLHQLAAVLPDPAGASVPDPSTLAKITRRCGQDTIAKLHKAQFFC